MNKAQKMKNVRKEESPSADIGILGGTGLYDIEGIEGIREVSLKTPFGAPSDAFMTGTLEGKRVAFLSRHGRGHRILPAEINSRANVWGFKKLGVRRVISVNSVGSLREDIRPRDMVVADQFFDRTSRVHTFFGDGVVAHIGFAQPVCPQLSRAIYEAGKSLGFRIHSGGTYICIEGPAFSTVAESKIYRSWGCDVIGMTSATEAKLFREAEICYSTLNLATDYDVWREGEESVSVDLIMQNLGANIQNAKAVIKKTLAALPAAASDACGCGEALKNAIVTRPAAVPKPVRRKLYLIIGRYMPE
jgi:5'-methylthioadenosine phosphorylase